MKMTRHNEHTPGPWRVQPQPDLSPEVCAGPLSLATVWTDELPPSESGANASLIAAAPELLEALVVLERDVRFLVEDMDLPKSALDRPSMVAARAAIAEAQEVSR